MTTPLASSLYLANPAISRDLPPVVINDSSFPLVSIVTPSYNQSRFIRETIESVLNQDYPNIEYWVIDGGSTDETVSILREYDHDPRFHWISEKDEGQSDAINKGLARCRGEIFNWLCSDDMYLPGAFARVANAWMNLSKPAVVYGWARLIDHHGDDLGYCPSQSSKITLEKMLRYDSFPMQQAAFIPTESLRALGGVDLSYQYAMDVDLWIKLIEKMPFHHIPCDLGLYRLHKTSKTVSLSVQFITDVNAILERAAQRNLLPSRRARSYAYLFAARVYLTPDAWNPRMAFNQVYCAIRSDASVGPLAVFIFLKGVARAILGEKYWSKMRFLQLKVR
jgi:glycosyltransferase involved in cell wall biosynthesis